MSVYNSELHCMMPSPGPVGRAGAAVAVAAPAADGESGVGNFFHHMLDVVNPLQHLPVVGTLYRAITGDKIGAVEKIAGDALYGGLWGAVGSVADVAFEAATGKDFGGTMLALVTGDNDASRAVADATPHSVSKGDFGDRLWAMLTGSEDEAPVAVARVTAPTITANASLPSGELPALPPDMQVAANPQIAALTASLTASMTAKGVDPQIADRALYAYRRSMAAPQAPLLASIH